MRVTSETRLELPGWKRGGSQGPTNWGVGCASCSIPLVCPVLDHIQGKMTLSNSSWRDGLLAFMEINTSTSKTGTPSSVHSCPTICRLRVSSLFAVLLPLRNSRPQLSLQCQEQTAPRPSIAGFGDLGAGRAPSIHLLHTWPTCVLHSPGYCVLLGSWPCAFFPSLGSTKNP